MKKKSRHKIKRTAFLFPPYIHSQQLCYYSHFFFVCVRVGVCRFLASHYTLIYTVYHHPLFLSISILYFTNVTKCIVLKRMEEIRQGGPFCALLFLSHTVFQLVVLPEDFKILTGQTAPRGKLTGKSQKRRLILCI